MTSEPRWQCGGWVAQGLTQGVQGAPTQAAASSGPKEHLLGRGQVGNVLATGPPSFACLLHSCVLGSVPGGRNLGTSAAGRKEGFSVHSGLHEERVLAPDSLPRGCQARLLMARAH